jgi:hypothetical protein
MKLILLAIILALTPFLAYGQEQLLFRDETKLKFSSGESCYAKLALEKAALRRGEAYAVEYTFYNACGVYWIYNFSFNGLLRQPGKLAIYDADKKYIGDLIDFEVGSRRGENHSDWVYFAQGTQISSKIRFKAGYVPLTKYGLLGELLPSGRYYVQLILYKAFFSDNPNNLGDDKPSSNKKFDKSEAIRSNAIEIQIVNK